jgi:hypothetical protein
MRLIKSTEEAVWRLIEWSFVMGALTWLLVRMWSESIYDRNRRRARRPWFHFARRRSSIGVAGDHPDADTVDQARSGTLH